MRQTPALREQTQTIAQALQEGRERLKEGSETANLDAQVLLAHLLGVERTWLLARPEIELSSTQQASWAKHLFRLEQGEALPYVLGEWEFYGLSFGVTPDVLIPRPETELLVESALEWLEANQKRRRAIDVGTGSGCIAITLAVKVPDLAITASDVSLPALKVARRNARRHQVSGRVEFTQADLLAGQSGPIDLICANLPYIPNPRLAGLDVAKREPRLALDGGPDGLRLIKRLLQEAKSVLAPGGQLLAEIDESQEASASGLAQAFFPGATITVSEDLTGKARLLRLQN